jgi:OmpA-OmpF porin, OOP family
MNKKMLCAALLCALGASHAAGAQEVLDDRWYLSFGPNILFTDNDRDARNHMFGGQIGFGRFLNPNLSVDGELFWNNPKQKGSQLNWSLYGAGMTARYHFRNDDDNWWPYVAGGLGVMRHEQELSDPLGGRPVDRRGSNLYASLGAGLHGEISDRWAVRTEATFRADFDDGSGRGEDWFGDWLVSLNFLYRFGDLPAPAAPPAPPPPPPPRAAPPCEELDSDGDGVNDCLDRCPNSQPGQAVGPDGCPVPLTIDLRGVNFDFDKATLRPDAVQILNEAIEILRNYPELRVEVAGHTDSIGTEQYNQGLSERRARAAYDYLVSNGIGANRLVGPVGHGESRPIAPNTTPDGGDNPEGRAQNRRTELNVQN